MPLVDVNGVARDGTTAQRPTNASVGNIYFDTTLGKLLSYNGTSWVEVSGDAALPEGNGAAAGTGVTAQEAGGPAVHRTVLTLVNTPVVLADEAGVVAYGGLKIYDFPAGAILFLGAVADLDLTKSSAGVNADWDGDIGLGTVTASNNATLSSTEQNLIPTTATPQAVAGVTTGDCLSTNTEAAKVIDGTATAVDAYLNILVDDTDHDVTTTPCNIIVNGTITLSWCNLGDK